MIEGKRVIDDVFQFPAIPGDFETHDKRAAAERQDFINRAAIAYLATAADPRISQMIVASLAYTYAEALWAERERRRNV